MITTTTKAKHLAKGDVIVERRQTKSGQERTFKYQVLSAYAPITQSSHVFFNVRSKGRNSQDNGSTSTWRFEENAPVELWVSSEAQEAA